jgi:hypothetical protein
MGGFSSGGLKYLERIKISIETEITIVPLGISYNGERI